MIIHCVRRMADMETICGEKGMVPALDLHTGSWQGARMRRPIEEDVCPKCDALWRPIAMETQKDKYEKDKEIGIIQE